MRRPEIGSKDGASVDAVGVSPPEQRKWSGTTLVFWSPSVCVCVCLGFVCVCDYASRHQI